MDEPEDVEYLTDAVIGPPMLGRRGWSVEHPAPIDQLATSPLYVPPLTVRLPSSAADAAGPITELTADIEAEYGFAPDPIAIHIGGEQASVTIYGEPVGGEIAAGLDTATLVEQVRATIVAHLDELLTRDDVVRILNFARLESPVAVAELVPNRLELGGVRAVLRKLLHERVPIKPISVIVDTLADASRYHPDPAMLAERVRLAMARTICRRAASADGAITVIQLAPSADLALVASARSSEGGRIVALPGAVLDVLIGEVDDLSSNILDGRPVVIACGSNSRRYVCALFAERGHHVTALSDQELRAAKSVNRVATIGESIIMPPTAKHDGSLETSSVWGDAEYVAEYVDYGSSGMGISGNSWS